MLVAVLALWCFSNFGVLFLIAIFRVSFPFVSFQLRRRRCCGKYEYDVINNVRAVFFNDKL